MTPDPAIDVIREARRLISHDVANDATRLIERYREMQANFSGRLIHGPEADAVQLEYAADEQAHR